MAGPSIEIALLADIRDATNSIKKFAEQSTKSIAQVNKSSEAFANTLNSLKNIAIGGSIIASIKQIIDAGTEAEDNFNRLQGILKASGITADGAAERFGAFAKQLEATTRFGDDAIIAVAAQLQTITNFTEKGLKVATKAALDLSSAYKIDLQTATNIIGKAANGNVAAIQKLGLQFVKSKNEAETFSNVLAALTKIQGASERDALTFSGALAQLKNQLGNVLEAVGTAVIKNEGLRGVLTTLTEATLKLIEAIEKSSGSINNFLNILISAIRFIQANAIQIVTDLALAFLAFNFTSIVSGINATVTSLIGLIQYFGIARIAAVTFRAALVTTGVGALIVAIGLLVQKIAELAEEFGSITKAFIAFGLKAQIATQEFFGFSKKADELKQKLSDLAKEGQIDLGAKDEIDGIKALGRELAKTSKISEDTGLLRKKRIDESIEATKKLREEAEKAREEFEKKLKSGGFFEEAFKNPGVGLAIALDIKKINLSAAEQALAGQITSIFSAALKGRDGAVSLISSTIGSAVGAIFGPAFSGPITEIIGLLAQGPDAVAATIQQFVSSIPVIFRNIILSIPVIIRELAKGMSTVSSELAKNMPSVAAEFARAMVTDAVPAIAQAMVDQVVERFSGGIFKSGGEATGAVNSAFGAVGDFFGFADGGVVPPGFPNDSFPAKLTSGEVVLNEKQQAQLASSGGPESITVNLVIGEQQLANVILSLNRRNFRTAI